MQRARMESKSERDMEIGANDEGRSSRLLGFFYAPSTQPGTAKWRRFAVLVLAGAVCGALVPLEAGALSWFVFFDLRPTVLDAGNSGPTAGCGTLFKNTDTPLGAGNFTRCAGGVPATDDRISDGNHLSQTAGSLPMNPPYLGSLPLPAWAWNGAAALRFEDANGDGIPENGAPVRLIWLSNEQHTRSASIPIYGGDVRVHMHTRAGWADQQDAWNCPSSISVMGQPTRTVTCNDGSYGIGALEALGAWDTANNRVVWSNLDSDPGAGVVYAGQLKRVHNFGYVDCTSSSSGCAQGSLVQGLNWKEGWTDWQVAKITGSNQTAEQPLRDFQFAGTLNFFTSTSSLYFSTADILVDSASTGGVHNSWWNLRGRFVWAQTIPEPGTGLLLLSGLIGLAAQRRRNSA